MSPIRLGLIGGNEMSRSGIRLTVSEMRVVCGAVRGKQLGETWRPIYDRIAGYGMWVIDGGTLSLSKRMVARGMGRGRLC